MARHLLAYLGLLALAAPCACGRDYDPNSVCNTWGRREAMLAWAPALTVILFDQDRRAVCAPAAVTTRFQGTTRSLEDRLGDTAYRYVDGRLTAFDPRETGCYNVYSNGTNYWPCTDDVLEIEVRVPGCRPRTLRLTWWDNERLYGGLGAPWWNIPIQLDCDESAVTPAADASTTADASADAVR